MINNENDCKEHLIKDDNKEKSVSYNSNSDDEDCDSDLSNYNKLDEVEEDAIKNLDVLNQIDKKSIKSGPSIFSKMSLSHQHLNENLSNYSLFIQLFTNVFISALGLLYYFVHDAANIIVVGKFNDSYLVGSFGLAMLYINIIALSLGIGFYGGIDMLGSNAFGAKKYKLLGKHFLLGKITSAFHFIFMILPLCLFSHKIFNFLGIDYETGYIASRYCIAMLPSIFFNLQYMAISSYLMVMNQFKQSMYITLINISYYPFLCYYITYYLNLKEYGLGIASGILNFSNFIIAQIYISYYNPYPKTIVKKISLAYIVKQLYSKHYTVHLKIGIPCAIVFLSEWAGTELSSIISSYLGHNILAANTCFYNFVVTIAMLNASYIDSILVAVGNSAGFGSKSLVYRYTKICIFMSIIINLFLITFSFFFKNLITSTYTNNEDIKKIFKSLMIYYYIIAIPDSINQLLTGALRGINKQEFIAKLYIFAYFLFNLPLMLIFCFLFNMGAHGIWIPILMTTLLCCIVNLLYFYSIDMDKLLMDNNDIIGVKRKNSFGSDILSRKHTELLNKNYSDINTNNNIKNNNNLDIENNNNNNVRSKLEDLKKRSKKNLTSNNVLNSDEVEL